MFFPVTSLASLAKLITIVPLLAATLSHHGVDGAGLPFPGESLCPDDCSVVGANPQNWTTYSAVNRLKYCDESMLLDFSVFTPIGGGNSNSIAIRACTERASHVTERRNVNHVRGFANGTASNETTSSTVSIEIASSGSMAGTSTTSSVLSSVMNMKNYLSSPNSPSVLFSVHRNHAIGVFAGALVKDTVLNSTAFQELQAHIQANGVADSLLLQVCEPDLADLSFGLFIATANDASLETQLVGVQGAVAGWVKGTCASIAGGNSATVGSLILPVALPTRVSGTKAVRDPPSRVEARAACKTTKAVSGDSCDSLARKCGISLADFQKYNPGSSFCSGLQPTQPVCCGAGTLPTPVQQADGTCATYLTVSGDWCAKIAAANGVSTANLETWNKNTWGWGGCDHLFPGVMMCLSTGNPPMPAPAKGAICGPQVSGTAKPTDGTKLADLNQCPLKACCDIWGQCGTTAEFCTKSGNGAPGTALPNENGCISNCGTDIIKGTAPADFKAVAYFEGWNPSRPCMNMDVDQIDSTKYTHIHFGFAQITRGDWKVSIPQDTQAQFKKFVAMKTSMKKILSFGGWTFSTAPMDYDIFRTGMQAANRDALATNVAKFIADNNLDGVDFDWEYPGAPDLPGIPAGSPDDGPNYLKFLTTIKGKLSGKSLSIAAPASYWYLKGFPIAQMSKVVQYIVYMTYDLHGQWDYGNKYSTSGCDAGNCLRSHVNITETLNALSMITKAGVPSGQILVGVSSYGRSFKMTAAGCTGPMCTYVGPESAAEKGLCTDTAGYIGNAEIDLLAGGGAVTKRYVDTDSDSDIVVFHDTQWVAYMTEERKNKRTVLYKSLNMGGISDWAVDLQRMLKPGDSGNGGGGGNESIVAMGAIEPTIEGCTNDKMKNEVLTAWRETTGLTGLQYSWFPGGRWQKAMDLYMGEGSRKDNVQGSWGDPGPVGVHIVLNYYAHNAKWIEWPHQHYAWIYCTPEAKPGGSKDDKGCDNARAYTWDSLGTFWSAHYVVLCPHWWDEDRTVSLEKKLRQVEGDKTAQQTMETWKGVRSRSLLHETYHWDFQQDVEKLDDWETDPLDVAYKAKMLGTEHSRKNVESYAISALAIYVMYTYGRSEDPPKPERWPWTSSNPPPPPTDEIADVKLVSPPEGWVAPVSTDSKFFTWKKEDHPDAVRLSEVGDYLTVDWLGVNSVSEGGDCWQDEQFYMEAQCKLFCKGGECKTVKDSEGHDNWQCGSCVTFPDDCENRDYPTWWSCKKMCGKDGKCTRKDGYSTVSCSGCTAVHVCKEGTYDDFNECSDNCDGGACNQKAGEPGVKCIYCPT